MTQPNDFRGNKSSLPQKPCVHCKRPMTWRRAWAKNWNEVKYCSARCRTEAGRAGRNSATGQ